MQPTGPVLITGGLGYLGSHLSDRLLAAGETVRVFARPRQNGTRPSIPAGVEVFWGDIRDAAAVERAVAGSEVVIHLVSNFRKGGGSDRREAREVNVGGTTNVAAACARHGVGQLIHGSTIGVHGSVLEIPADEETPFNPGDLYQETKVEAEREVWRYHRETGLPATVLRPISIFGPGDTRMLKLFKLVQKGRFVMVGDGTALFQPAYIDDVVEGFLRALRNPGTAGEAFIIGGEEYVPLNELVGMVAEELGVRPPRLRLPLAPVLALADLCERCCVPLRIDPPLHRRRVSFFHNDRAFKLDKARRVLGFAPRFPLREALRRTVAWYREHGWL